ncbi:ABC transporter substrate-binding protein [Roseovarius aquimarinus]|uniref:ABC transporter substrate-binding protein n=1 Tax=Roseovarius aquimarinus TaxID=1229156 RepID=A0ABW7I5A8_9RHOB
MKKPSISETRLHPARARAPEGARSAEGPSRRSILAGGAAASLGAALPMGWARPARAAPKRGGVFRVGVHDGSSTDGWDPATTESILMIHASHVARAYLTEITNTNDLGPDLATSWEATKDDASEWRFELATNATFHDGRKVTSADVVASMMYHLAEDSASAAKPLMAGITNVRADGDHAVVFELEAGNADLPYLVSDYHLTIQPAKPDGGIEWENGIGCGPYKVTEFSPGIRCDFVRHDGWHRADEGAWFDEVKMTVLNDPNARQAAIVTGDVDAVTDIDLKTADRLAQAPGVILDDVPSGTHITMPMFCDVAPFDDVNVRLALKHAIGRQEIVDKILFGRGIVGNDHPIGPTMPYHADLPQREQDLDKARFHLKKAGHDTLSVEISVNDAILSGATNMCSLFAEQARPAGLDIKVNQEPVDGYWSNVWLKKPFCVVSWAARPTPDVMFSLAYKAGADWNESHWENERFNELLLKAKSETDDALRSEMYAEMQMLCRDDGGTIVPFFRNRTSARRDNVMHDDDIAAVWELDGARGYHRWWFA